MKKVINQELLDAAMSYEQYLQLLESLLAKGKTTGENQSEVLLNYAKLNDKRMKKWEKIGKIAPELTQKLSEIDERLTLLVITEGWCGDAAQNLPFIHKMAEINPKIEIKVILRDEHPEVMNEFLTQGGKSIPKVIGLDPESLTVLGDWGPRPASIQAEFLENRQTQVKSNAEFTEYLHFWYAKDKGITLQSEFLAILDVWKTKQQSLPVQVG
ncbi:MAG: thioredoxin family protein [Cytophagales bacterium CG12_big_fil_rev_8_21_14_0_65_40_12]|nr:MAG: thioredoxin family protein [Cytophagales bacterium CG12_big_fil_rev_8_21_14_0_65_40_12]PIW06194.1 MAG: thioredoxin family protein [Cytophagales bacterium CG17_big_fil_post_rev_8_21_14_2_50_40_13]